MKSSQYLSVALNRSQPILALLSASFVLFFFAQVSNAATLKEIVKHTLANNPAIQAAKQEMLIAKDDIKIAKSGYLPKLNLELGVGREETSSPATGNEAITLTREEASLRLSQVVYDGNSIRSEIALQKARYEGATFSYIDSQENVALRVSQAYLNVLRDKENLVLLKEALDEHKKIYEQMSLRNDAGVGSQADLDQVNVRLSLATNSYLDGRNDFLNTRSQFNGLVGFMPDEDKMQLPVDFSIPLALNLDEYLKVAMEQHPAIKSAEANVDAAKAAKKAAKSAHHPTLSLEGDRTWNNDIDGLEGKNEDWVIALRFRYNILNGGKDKARNRKASNLLQQATEQLKQVQWATEEGMRLSWYTYESTAEQLKHLNVHVESAVATKAAYDEQYKLGKRNLIELLNAQNEVTRAKQTYLRTQYEQLLSQVRVLNSSGQFINSLGL